MQKQLIFCPSLDLTRSGGGVRRNLTNTHPPAVKNFKKTSYVTYEHPHTSIGTDLERFGVHSVNIYLTIDV